MGITVTAIPGTLTAIPGTPIPGTQYLIAAGNYGDSLLNAPNSAAPDSAVLFASALSGCSSPERLPVMRPGLTSALSDRPPPLFADRHETRAVTVNIRAQS